jgi:hypothetical protein
MGLTLFGEHFSKFHLIGPLYLFDFTLIIGFFVSLFFIKSRLKFPIIFFVIIISIIYLIYSIILNKVYFALIIRQFALFGYLIVSYLMFNFLFNDKNLDIFLFYIKKLVFLGFLIQLFYFLYLKMIGQFSFNGYNYWSPLIVMLLISYGAYILSYYNIMKSVKAQILFIIVLFLSTTTGHSSAFLGIFVLPFILFYFEVKKIYKIIIFFLIIVILMGAFLFIHSFSDVNAMWRIYYWYMTLKNIFIEHFGIFGNGFGVPYANDKVIYFLQVVHGASTKLGEGYESYLTPFHNSFLTIFFNIGFLPGILVFYPFYKFYKNYKYYIKFYDIKFLFLTLIGISVLSSLNVELELPHSSLFYWTIYFLLLFKMERIAVK